MTYLDYIGNFVLSILAGVGLLINTEKLIIQVNIISIFLMIISSIFFSYGVYSLVKDFPKIIQKIKDKI